MKISKDHEIFISEDGSKSLVSNRFNVSYHSIYGALEESITVFLSAGLHYFYKSNKDISIFEMGFGTGFNAFLTFLESSRVKNRISYTGIEKYPIPLAIAAELEYPKLLNAVGFEKKFLQMHEVASNEKIVLGDKFDFKKIIGDLMNHSFSDTYDVIYYDAFAPTSQEELWTSDTMKKMYDITTPGGVLVTYCAKGSFKRALKAAGFTIEALPGPGKKREITRAIKPL